jgi:hypothetical protein
VLLYLSLTQNTPKAVAMKGRKGKRKRKIQQKQKKKKKA